MKKFVPSDLKTRSVYFAKLSVPVTILIAFGKCIIGLLSVSFFPIISALYNVGIAGAKIWAIRENTKMIESLLELKIVRLKNISWTSFQPKVNDKYSKEYFFCLHTLKK